MRPANLQQVISICTCSGFGDKPALLFYFLFLIDKEIHSEGRALQDRRIRYSIQKRLHRDINTRAANKLQNNEVQWSSNSYVYPPRKTKRNTWELRYCLK